MSKRLRQPNKARIKRKSFAHRAKELSRKHTTDLPSAEPFDQAGTAQPWLEHTKDIDIKSDIPYITSDNNQSDLVKRSHTLAMIEESYPSQSWIHVYTDGSATAAVKNGGAGILIQTPEGHKLEYGIATGKHCTNYSAECQALIHAVNKVKTLNNSDCQQVVFLSDAKSVLLFF